MFSKGYLGNIGFIGRSKAQLFAVQYRKNVETLFFSISLSKHTGCLKESAQLQIESLELIFNSLSPKNKLTFWGHCGVCVSIVIYYSLRWSQMNGLLVASVTVHCMESCTIHCNHTLAHLWLVESKTFINLVISY